MSLVVASMTNRYISKMHRNLAVLMLEAVEAIGMVLQQTSHVSSVVLRQTVQLV